MAEFLAREVMTLTAGEALLRYRAVKLNGSTAREVVYADAGDLPIGVVRDATADENDVAIIPICGNTTIPMVASAAITVNVLVYSAADGKVSSTVSGRPIGRALKAASGDGSVIEVLPLAFDDFFAGSDAGLVSIFDDFNHYVTADTFTTTATDSGSASVSDGVGGILALAASDGTAADNDETYVHTTTEVFKFATGKPLWFEARVAITEANTDDANVLVGMMDAVAANSLLDDGGGPEASYSGAVFYKVDGGTAWKAEVSIAGTQTAVTLSTDTFPGDGTYQKLGIEFLPGTGLTAGIVNFYIDGSLVGSATSFNYTSATEMDLVVGVKNGGANLETLNVDYIRATQVR